MKNTTHTIASPRKGDRQGLERRRLKAAGLFEKGLSQSEVARRLGVSPESASQWQKTFKAQGIEGLKSKGKPGPEPLLTEEDKENIKAAILKGPKEFGFKTDLWTAERLTVLIEKVTGIKYHSGHTWKVVTSLGFSCQKPETIAKERDEEKINHWKHYLVPVLKKMG